jgi:phosphate transport system permease protein
LDPAHAPNAEASRPRWAGRSWFQNLQELVVPPLILFCALVTVLTTVGIVGVLGFESARFFAVWKGNPLAALLGTEIDWSKGRQAFGMLPLLWGTFVIALGSSLLALPVGLLSALYLSEYAPRRVRAVLKPTLELLAGVPSIVYGYLALLFVTPALKAALEPAISVDPYNALAACIVVGIMIVPMVSSLSEDVLSAVPAGLREAAYGLGATKFEVATRVVLPAGLSGVFAAFILAISRAVGETMAVVLAAGQLAQITPNPLRSVETMTTYVVGVITGDSSTEAEYLSLFAVGMVLFLMTLGMNVLSGLVMRRYREVYQ